MTRDDKNKYPTENLSQNFPEGTGFLLEKKTDSSSAADYLQILYFVEHLVRYRV